MSAPTSDRWAASTDLRVAARSHTSGMRRVLVVGALAAALIAALGYTLDFKRARSLSEFQRIVETSKSAFVLGAETRTAEGSERAVDDVTEVFGMPSLLVGLAALVTIAASALLFRPTSPAKSRNELRR